MFFLNYGEIRQLMKKQGLDCVALANKTDLSADFVASILEPRTAKANDFGALVKLGKALNCSPFALIQNQCAF